MSTCRHRYGEVTLPLTNRLTQATGGEQKAPYICYDLGVARHFGSVSAWRIKVDRCPSRAAYRRTVELEAGALADGGQISVPRNLSPPPTVNKASTSRPERSIASLKSACCSGVRSEKSGVSERWSVIVNPVLLSQWQ